MPSISTSFPPYVTIIGLGMMGGSIAKAIKARSATTQIHAIGRNETPLNAAKSEGIIDHYSTHLNDLPSNTPRLTILATPLESYDAFLSALAAQLGEHHYLTDIGSVKSYVVELAKTQLTKTQQLYFIPAHPIAGSEQVGYEASKSDLFSDKKTIITPFDAAQNTHQVEAFWQHCGAHCHTMDANTHDLIYAQISHLPQYLSFCYNQYKPGTVFTRLQHSNLSLWQDIFAKNTKALDTALLTYQKELQQFISCKNKQHYLKSAQQALPKAKKQNTASPLPVILGAALIHNTQYIDYAGSGFADFTKPLAEADLDRLEMDQLEELELFVTTSFSTSIINTVQKKPHSFPKF